MNRLYATEELITYSDDTLLALWENIESEFHSLPYGSWERCAAYASLQNISAALTSRRHLRTRYAQINR